MIFPKNIIKKSIFNKSFRFLSSVEKAHNDFLSKNKFEGIGSSNAVEVPKETDVVIIGGGALGCSTFYHLTKLGITNTVLLEAHQLTAGTTWHSAGLILLLRHSDVDIQLLKTTRNLIMQLKNETGVDPGWINNGSVYLAESEKRMTEMKKLRTTGRTQNVESFILDPKESKKLYPLMNVDDLYATLYCPGDGIIEPSGYCTALARGGTRAGGKVIEKCPVTAITIVPTSFGGKRVTEVHTPYGVIKTNCIVNATGSWANYITKMVGVDIPLVSYKHMYATTEAIPGIQNMPTIRDTNASIYLKLQGDALTIGSFENDPISIKEIERKSPFTLFDVDWDVFGPYFEKAINRIPALENTGIKSTICGPESFTPDHKPIMGEDPNVSGFFHCCGFNSGGMMLSGGCGNQMAKWVVNGRPDYDMFAYDIRRYRPSLNSNTKWIRERSHEAFSLHYSIHFPHDEPLAGRGQIKSPLHEILTNLGCVYQEKHGWERPGWFNSNSCPVQEYDWYGAYKTPLNKNDKYKEALAMDYNFNSIPNHIRKECLSVRNSAALFDMSSFGKFYLTGPDAQMAADWIFSADVQKDLGSIIYTLMLNSKGFVEADLTVSILDGNETCSSDPNFSGKGFYMVVGSAVLLQNWAHIHSIIRKQNWNVEIINCSDHMSLLSLQGPKSRDILTKITDADLSNEAFPFSTHKVISVAGHKVRALRLSFVGELGWELHIPNEKTVDVFNAIQKVGKKYGLVNAGYRAIDSLSAEKGYVHWHADLRADDTPLEAGLGFACKLKNLTPFLGREALELKKKEGLKKKLVTMTLEDSTVPLWGLEGIIKDGVNVGYIRRAGYAFYLGTSIAYGYVKKPCGGTVTKDFLTTGDWEIEAIGVKHKAKLHIKHPFDPQNLRTKGNYSQ